jgi:hypothetical protein
MDKSAEEKSKTGQCNETHKPCHHEPRHDKPCHREQCHHELHHKGPCHHDKVETLKKDTTAEVGKNESDGPK